MSADDYAPHDLRIDLWSNRRSGTVEVDMRGPRADSYVRFRAANQGILTVDLVTRLLSPRFSLARRVRQADVEPLLPVFAALYDTNAIPNVWMTNRTESIHLSDLSAACHSCDHDAGSLLDYLGRPVRISNASAFFTYVEEKLGPQLDVELVSAAASYFERHIEGAWRYMGAFEAAALVTGLQNDLDQLRRQPRRQLGAQLDYLEHVDVRAENGATPESGLRLEDGRLIPPPVLPGT